MVDVGLSDEEGEELGADGLVVLDFGGEVYDLVHEGSGEDAAHELYWVQYEEGYEGLSDLLPPVGVAVQQDC